LFDTSQLHAGKLELHCEPFDLAAHLREHLKALRMSAPERTIRLDVSPKQPLDVVADADRIGQVIANYVTNALKYSPPDQPIDVQASVADGHARIAVVDHGQGIPVSERERIWQPFYRSSRVKVQSGSYLGLGLGLHICKAIVERHSGRIGLDTTVGQGSTFWFTLPLATPSQVSELGQPEARLRLIARRTPGGSTPGNRASGRSKGDDSGVRLTRCGS
jgi:signal transduction histidine kinase